MLFPKSEVLRNRVGPVCARHHQQPGWGCESWAQTDRFDHNGFCKGMMPHRRLLHKLDYYGIRGSIHKWINSWLSGRSQQVVFDGQASDPVQVLSRVPQGSVLGLILFLIFFINDLPGLLFACSWMTVSCTGTYIQFRTV